MGNRPCHHCLSCYDEDIDRTVIFKALSVSPLDFRRDHVNKKAEQNDCEDIAKFSGLAEHSPSGTHTAVITETPSCTPKQKMMFRMDDSSNTRKETANVFPSNNLSPSKNYQHDNFHRQVSKTFSSEHFRSLSSESLGRETRTEKSILRRLSSACEREDYMDEHRMSRSFT